MNGKKLASIVLLSALAVSVQGQPDLDTIVDCRSDDNCTSTTTGNFTVRDCCLGDGNLSFSFNNKCTQCIVIGWFNDTFIGEEQGPPYILNVDYIKGAKHAGVNIGFDVEVINGTAEQGIAKDYVLKISNDIVAVYNKPPDAPIPQVSVTFRRDGLALESSETVSFRLKPRSDNIPLLSQVGVIFKDIIDLTILDNDSVQIYFSEDDFGADEGGDLNVVIIKSIATAIPVGLTITPLTIDAAIASGGPTPLNSLIPLENPFSPNKATMDDFNTSVITVVFGRDDRTKTVPIKTVNDAINEANEQVFAVQLNSSNSDVDLSVRPATLCRIRDNDRIRIGFVHPEYMYFEPTDETFIGGMGTCDVEPNVVCLQKEGGVKTEQTFKIAVQRSRDVPSDDRNIQPATEGEDYTRTEVAVRTIAPDQQSINIPFVLLPDDLPETTEAFQISSSPDTTPNTQGNITYNVSTYDNPMNLYAECYVIILDNDTKILIGFEKTEYRVYEFNKTLNVVVKVLEPSIDKSLPPRLSIRVIVQTASGSAVGGVDYKRVIFPDIILFFNNGTRSHSFDVSITDDDIFELTENFTLKLELNPPLSVVEIVQEVATIDILDDDVIVIGFEQKRYTVNETAEVLPVVIRVISPPDDKELPASVSVNVLALPGTATDGDDYMSPSGQDAILVFDDDTRTIPFYVDITNDDVFEISENFTLELMLLDASTTDRVMFDPEKATINILDPDVVQIYFTEDDYVASEADGVCNVTIVKSIGIAYPVVLTVTPLTVDDALASGDPTPPIPRDNPFSPNKASSEDFDDTVIKITIGPDEIRSVEQVSIPIANDAINEATEQVFIVKLTSSNAEVDLSRRPATLCRIRDNDPIRIGFEKSEYTYSEPESETFIDETDDNPIFLQKEGGVVTEQTFFIAVQRSSDVPSDKNIRPATQGEDYVLPETSLYTMHPNQQQINVPFTVLTDALPEATEGFKVSSSPDMMPQIIRNISYEVPSYSNPQSLSDETFVIIMDDDPIIIGFEKESYTVNESVGTLYVVVKVFNIPDDEALPAPVSLNVLTVNGTATGEDDYEELDDLLIFDDVRMYTINVTINNDTLREPPPDETFTLVLQHSIVEPLNVKLEPSTATINIVDDDPERIIIPVNDTIIGDPLFSVPILVSEDDLKMIGPRLSLCYEVHGARDKIYNMITDKCASVNAHYNDLTSSLNVIDRVGVRATDNKDQCKNIQVDLEGCEASIDGFPMDTYRSEGIVVRKYNNRVRIMVPNCNELSLVMWVICETRTLDDPNDDTNTITGDMIKLVVTRGLNFGRKAHGLIGQFWNIPVSVTPYEGNDKDGNPVEQVFVVNITTNGASHGYAGHLYHMTWDRQMTPCLYVGNSQAGPIHEIPYPNDYVIEGSYENYAVPSLFTEDEYGYSLFEGKCLDLPTAATTP